MSLIIKLFFAFCLLFISSNLYSQNKYYAIYFKDKGVINSRDTRQFLSNDAAMRRIKNGISYDEYDIPVNSDYIDILINKGFNVKFTSKWLNCAIIEVSDTNLFLDYNFVSYIKYIGGGSINNSILQTKDTNPLLVSDNISRYINDDAYKTQLAIVNGLELHSLNFLGKGINIAIMDDGFLMVNQLEALDHLFLYNRILYTANYLDNKDIYNIGSGHGASIISILAADSYNMRGSAPEANYMLFRTEDYYSETLLEEYAWVKAAEVADSIGVDVISSSQNYATMDNILDSHTYSDMDGKTCPITIGAQIAAQKGIIVVTSAGNDGNSAWKYISAPADAEDVITVGGVTCDSIYWHESSIGPTYDGRLKPDICALSSKVVSINPVNGNILYGSGTSYAAPVVAGFFACLIQAYPEVSSFYLKNTVYNTSSNVLNPNYEIGRGIPNFARAYFSVGIKEWSSDDFKIYAYPNPFSKTITIYSDTNISDINVYSVDGKILPCSIVYNGTNANIEFNSSHSGIVYFCIKTKNNIIRNLICLKM